MTNRTPTNIARLRQNWSLTPTSPILPPSLNADICSSACPTELLEALTHFSDLTVGEKQRAWGLLDTYFQARIREASYRGTHGGIYANLSVEDVNKAIESEKRMRGGREMQRRNSIAVPVDGKEVETEVGKRKYSIHHEILDTSPSTAKKAKLILPPIQTLLKPSTPEPTKMRKRELAPIATEEQLPSRKRLLQQAVHRLNVARVELSRAQNAHRNALETFEHLEAST